MTTEYTLYAYERNQVSLYAVQGEAQSRTFVFDVVAKSGVVIAESNAEVTDQPLDLSGFARCTLVILNSSGDSVDGTITDDENGQISFTLPSGCCLDAGNFPCEIILGGSAVTLKIIGISIRIDTVTTYAIQLNAGEPDCLNVTIKNRDGTVRELTAGEELVLVARRTPTAEEALRVTADTSDARDGGYDLIFSSSSTYDLSGEYVYGISILSSGTPQTVIRQAPLTVWPLIAGREET